MTFEMEAQGAGSIINVDELQNHGINAGDISKLKSAGVCSVAVCIYVEMIAQKLKLTYNSQCYQQQGETCVRSRG